MINSGRLIKYLILFPVMLILYHCSPGVATEQEVTVEELRQHITYLSSDSLAGRYPGTEGDMMAATYIRDQFVSSGLKPEAEDGFQYFTLLQSVSPGQRNHFEVNDSAGELGSDFAPFPFSGNAELTAGVSFCGYGFSISEENMAWNDYADIDIAGNWVMVLRGDPEAEDPASIFAPYSSDRHKAYLAAENGAAGLIMVSGQKFDKEDELVEIRLHQGRVSIPVIHVTRPTANMILSRNGSSVEILEDILVNDMQPESFHTNTTVSATTDLVFNEAQTMNVIASIRGNDPGLRDEYIVIGAHYDHLGTGGEGSSSRRPGSSVVHPGADDNASGVAAMLEIAEKLRSINEQLRRSYLFIAFGAEEKGLLGSKYFIENPVVDLESVKAMINLDMVGRKNEEKTLQIGGVGTSAEGQELLHKVAGNYEFNTVFSMEGFGPSDHASFYAKDIPVFFITTGAHPDYHTPDDTADRINYAGLKRVADFVTDLSAELGMMDNYLSFTEAGPRAPAAPRHGNRRVSLGIMPDFTSSGGDGLRADHVTPGRPAAQGGMQQGDKITSINGNPVGDIHEYMYRLSQLDPGDIINVEVIRGEKKEILIIQL